VIKKEEVKLRTGMLEYWKRNYFQKIDQKGARKVWVQPQTSVLQPSTVF
jgi:hypothetical protein